MSKKIALVLGATGLIGSNLLSLLLECPDYKQVRALTRRKINKDHPKLQQVVIDFNDLDAGGLEQAFKADDVFCCLGTTIKKAGTREQFRKVDYEYPLAAARLAKAGGASQFLIVTALGANEKSLFFYNRVKGEVEAALRTLNFQSLHIFRPSLLLGERKEFRLGEAAAAKASQVLAPVFIGPLARYKPIEGKAVAEAMLAAACYVNGQGVHVYESLAIRQMANGAEYTDS